jgi:DNA-binding beta-propeller fold protein YncE
MLYWTEEGGIFRTSSVLPATGTNQVTRVVNVLRPHGLALDLVGGKLYWAELQKIRRANLDGTQIETVLTVPLSDPSPDTIAVDAPAGKVYWTEFVESGRIRRANLDGTDTETVLGELDWPSGLHLVPASRTPGPGA